MHYEFDNPDNCWPSVKVAQWLGFKNAEQFMRNRNRLESETGFPAPLPGLKKLVWAPLQLKAWVASLIPESQRKALGQISGNYKSPVLTSMMDEDWSDELDARLRVAS